MKKIIIQFPDDMSEEKAMGKVVNVIMQGRISKTTREGVTRDQFCFITTFKDNTVVYSRNKNTDITDSFLIYREADGG